MMCKILIFKYWFFLISTHFSGAVQTPPQSTWDNAFNIYFWAEKNAIIAYLSTTYSYNDQSNCRLLSAACPPLPVHYLSFWYCSEIFSDLSNYKLLVYSLSTTCPLLVHYFFTTICPPPVLQILWWDIQWPLQLQTICPLLVHKILK
jgi:hypothetical protein